MINPMIATKGQQIRVPIRMDAATTGLVLGDFTVTCATNGAYIADPAATLSLSLVEVDDSNAPGLYEALLTPTEAGALSVIFQQGGETHGAFLQVGLPTADITQFGAEGSHTITLQDSGSNPIEGVVVRVFTSAGGGLIARGTTDASGQVTFDLPAGDYQARMTKAGWGFDNPQDFTVVEGEGEDPYVEYLLPTSAAVGDNVAVAGRYFTGDNVRVLAGGEVVVPDIASDGRVLIFVVPDVDSPATIQVRKDDPENPGEYLTSESLSLTVS